MTYKPYVAAVQAVAHEREIAIATAALAGWRFHDFTEECTHSRCGLWSPTGQYCGTFHSPSVAAHFALTCMKEEKWWATSQNTSR